jgi:hypothetical protein
MRLLASGLIVVLACGLMSCAVPAVDRNVETSRIFSRTPASLVPGIEESMRSQNIEVTGVGPNQTVVKGRQRPIQESDWVDCSSVHVRDTEGERRRRAPLRDLRLELDVTLDRLNRETLVTISPTFIGTFHNSFKNRVFESRCRSTGQLEPALLNGLGASSAADAQGLPSGP